MIDLNALLGAALQQAVDTATAPLVARIEELEQAHQVLVLRVNATPAAETAAEPLTREDVADLVRDGIDAKMDDIESDIDDKISRAIDDMDISDPVRDAVRDLLESARIELN